MTLILLPEKKIKRHAHCMKLPCLLSRVIVFQMEISLMNGYIEKLRYGLELWRQRFSRRQLAVLGLH